MATELLNDLMARAGRLSAEEKKRLARFLSEEARQDSIRARKGTRPQVSGDRHNGEKVVEWLKAHAVEYAGQYVALNGDELVGSGLTIRDAHAAAQRNGCPQALLVHVPPTEGGSWGGW